jgi:hypothetical protein
VRDLHRGCWSRLCWARASIYRGEKALAIKSHGTTPEQERASSRAAAIRLLKKKKPRRKAGPKVRGDYEL